MTLHVLATDLRPGTIVSVPVPSSVGRLDHKGIVTDRIGPDGWPMVIHNSHHFGQVVETTMSVFALRGIGPVTSDGCPTKIPTSEVLRRARARIGQPWKATDNCEHFVAGAHELDRMSPQLFKKGMEAAFTVGPSLASAYMVHKSLRRRTF